jgi:CDP-glycerol glycerophosphotransferase (TagB/SpsB family)
MQPDRLPGIRRVPSLLRRLDDDVVLFESWHGRYADSPRAISEELQRRGAELEQVWAVSDPAAKVPDGIAVVEPGSLKYLELLGRARFVVSNNTMPLYFRKKHGSTYLQTWHGTPLKRIGFDVGPISPAGSPAYLSQLRREVVSWDVLLSPNRFSTEIFRRAFGFEGEILETGYPRNDLLSSPERDQVRERVRDELQIHPDVRAVLYAPTWRDNTKFSSELDLEAMAKAMGNQHVILLRAHERVAHTVALGDGAPVRNVSAYPDIRELYLAADVLITDYSSAMFDFAVTGKPMLFFTYDLAAYRDELRGFYFDFEAEAPGPLLDTTPAVIAALGDIDAVKEEHTDAYQRFVERFCHLDDGRASARVVDAVFGPQRKHLLMNGGGFGISRSPVSPEEELMLSLAGTEDRRRRMEPRILELLERVDFGRLTSVLRSQGLLPLVGTRLEQLAPERLAPSFRETVQERVTLASHRAALHGAIAEGVASALEVAGIPTVPLKGPVLAADVYEHAGLRESQDIDLLVTRERLDAAVAELERQGWKLVPDEENRALPRLHHVLEHPRPEMPTLELHWRVHWYETGFSSSLVARSNSLPNRGRRATPPDELAALLLFYCRDGFVGLRYAADIAAWWDSQKEGLELNALDPILVAHPELRDALLTSLQVAETMAGLPLRRLTSLTPLHTVRSDLANRLADWAIQGDADQVAANVTLIDWLLCPPDAYLDFVRRNLFPSRQAIRRLYRLGDDATVLPLLWQAAHGPKLVLRYLAAIWAVRGERRWTPVPTRDPKTAS